MAVSAPATRAVLFSNTDVNYPPLPPPRQDMSDNRQLAAAMALLRLGVACVSMAALSYGGRTAELLQGRMMVIDTPDSQGRPCCERELRLAGGDGFSSPGALVQRKDGNSCTQEDIKTCLCRGACGARSHITAAHGARSS